MKVWKKSRFWELDKVFQKFKWFHQSKNSILKKKDQNELQKNLNILQLRCSASPRMIKIKINQIMKLEKRFSTLQKWIKSKAWCKKYCTLKFFAHQIQRNEMFFVFVASQMILCSISSKMKLKMIFSSRDRIQNRCENEVSMSLS